MRTKKIMTLVLALILMLNVFSTGAFAASQGEEVKQLSEEDITQFLREAQAEKRSNIKAKEDFKERQLLLERKAKITDDGQIKEYDANEEVRIIVQVEGDSVVGYANERGIKINQIASIEREQLETDALDVQSEVKNAIRSDRIRVNYRHNYTTVFNGFSADVKYGDIDKIKRLSGVKDVRIANVYYPDMTTAHDFTNAETVWSEAFGGYKGEGMVIGIVDTGVNWDHPNFQAPADLTKAKYEEGEGKYTDKVVEGYNWADMNDEVRDFSSSQHGVHVAGIAAGKGEEFLGVAPEAQIIAEKVFGNDYDGSGAYTDDVVAAINHAVENGADVINMSLGSTGGYVLPDDPEQVAITDAVDAGVIVVVSAGNSAFATDGYWNPYAENPDIGIVGSPGVGVDTIQVAASNNLINLFEHYVNFDGLQETIGYGVDDWGVLGQELELVAIGGTKLGEPSDYEGIDVSDKIVLIIRGTHSFRDKTKWAWEQGAAGIIVYDHELPNSKFYVDQGGWEIPFMMIHKENGLALEELLKDGPITINVTFKESNIDTRTGQPTDFSSWGPTPDLQFKPEIMAPGGNIYSTVGKSSYELMSGTSMSSPYVAGGMALIAQAMQEKEIEPGNRNFVETAKTIAMNGAEPVKNDAGFEFQPRLQGAGMIKLDKAIVTPIRVTGEDGKPSITLKEIDDNTQFTINIKNDSEQDLTYNLRGTVQTDALDYTYEDYGIVLDSLVSVYMEDSEITFNDDQITIPAGGEADITATLNVSGANDNSFIEGYIYLEPEAEDIPVTSIPYFGFYGNWDEPNVIDYPVYTYMQYYWEHDFGTTMLVNGFDWETDEEELYFMADPYDASTYMFSPNGDDWFDELYPSLAFLRNAREMRIVIRDENGNKVRTVASDEFIRKPNVSYGYPTSVTDEGWKWDGMIYNAEGQYVNAPDGKYIVEFNTVIDYEGADWQTLTMPVIVDATEPELTITSAETTAEDGTYKLTWDVTEEGTGIDGYLIFVNGELVTDGFISGDIKEYNIDLPLLNNEVFIAAIDKAGNEGYDWMHVANTTITDETAPVITVEGPADYLLISVPYIEVTGTVQDQSLVDVRVRVEDPEDLPETPINEDESAVVDFYQYDDNPEIYELYTNVSPVKEGLNIIRYYAEDAAGNKTEFSNNLLYDLTPPVVENIEFDGGFFTEKAAYLTIKGNAHDNGLGYKLNINGNRVLDVFVESAENTEVDTNRSFEHSVKLVNGENTITIQAIDLIDVGRSNVTTIEKTADVDLEAGTVTIEDEVINLDDISGFGYFEPQINLDTPVELVTAKSYATVSGSVYASVYGEPIKLYIGGDFTPLNDEYEFQYFWILEEGDNEIILNATDDVGGLDTETIYAFVDGTAPTIDLTSPEGTEISLEEVYTITVEGKVSDNLSGYTLYINDEEAISSVDKSEKTFSEEVSLNKGENNITIYAEDELGNSSDEIVIKVTVTEKPEEPSRPSGGGSSSSSTVKDDSLINTTVSTNGGTVKDEDGNVEFVFEKGTFDKKAEVKVEEVDDEDVNEPKTSHNIIRVANVYEFTSSIDKFNKPVKVRIKYNKSKLNGINEELLGVYTFNEKTDTWEYVGGKVDKKHGVVEVELNHFSKYTVMTSTRTFADITNHWAKHEVEVMAARQIVDGRDGINYDPQGTITKAEYAKILVNLLGLEQEEHTGTFTDIADKWYTGYVEAALKAGIVTATEVTFSPDAAITREEMAVMVANTIKYVDETKATVAELTFEDKDQISESAIEAVAIAFNNGIINGRTLTTFVPQGTATRAEAATMIYRLLQTLDRI